MSGYGVKAFALSMVEAAITVTNGAVPVARSSASSSSSAASMLHEPVQLLAHVPEVLDRGRRAYRLVLITKGDLVHQTHKVTTSGSSTTSTTSRSCWRRTPRSTPSC